MLNAADSIEKFAPPFYIFPSFQQRSLGVDLKHLGESGTSDMLYEPMIDIECEERPVFHPLKKNTFLCVKRPGKACQDVSPFFPIG